MLGTVDYMAPEQAEANEDAGSDLAVVPYVPLVEPPFRSRSLCTKRRAWLAGSVVALGALTFAAAWFWWPDGDKRDPGQRAVQSQPPISVPTLEPALSLVGHTSTIECVAFLPGGTRLVSSDDDQQLLAWDLVAGRLAYRLAKGDDTGPALAVDDAGKWLATAADTDLLKLWDLSTRDVVMRLKGHHVTFSRAGDLLATALHEDPIALYDTTAHQEVGELVGHGTWVCALVFSNDGTMLISGDEDGVLRVWDVAQRTQRRAVTCDVQINSLAMVPGQERVAEAAATGWSGYGTSRRTNWRRHGRLMRVRRGALPARTTVDCSRPQAPMGISLCGTCPRAISCLRGTRMRESPSRSRFRPLSNDLRRAVTTGPSHSGTWRGGLLTGDGRMARRMAC